MSKNSTTDAALSINFAGVNYAGDLDDDQAFRAVEYLEGEPATLAEVIEVCLENEVKATCCNANGSVGAYVDAKGEWSLR